MNTTTNRHLQVATWALLKGGSPWGNGNSSHKVVVYSVRVVDGKVEEVAFTQGGGELFKVRPKEEWENEIYRQWALKYILRKPYSDCFTPFLNYDDLPGVTYFANN